jgi:hypothetical protein
MVDALALGCRFKLLACPQIELAQSVLLRLLVVAHCALAQSEKEYSMGAVLNTFRRF